MNTCTSIANSEAFIRHIYAVSNLNSTIIRQHAYNGADTGVIRRHRRAIHNNSVSS